MKVQVFFHGTGNSYMFRPWLYLQKNGKIKKLKILDRSEIWQVSNFVESHFYDTMIISLPFQSKDIYCLYLLTKINRHTVYFTSYPYFHEDFQRKSIKQQLWLDLLRENKVIAVSEACKCSLKKLGIEAVMIPHAVNTHLFSPSEKKTKGKYIIFFAGRLVPEKGIKYLLKLAKYFKNKRINGKYINVWIAGKGPLTNHLKEFSKKVSNLRYLGYISENKLIEAYSEADIFLLPSYTVESSRYFVSKWSEYFGLVLIEAMACGTPVISSACPGPKSIVTEKVGDLFPQKDYQTMKNLVLKYLKDEKMRIQKSKNAREKAVSEYSLEVVSKKWIKVLR